jgi:hypothetical protein
MSGGYRSQKTCHGSHGCHVLVAKGKNGHFWEIRAAMASHAPKLANWTFFPAITTTHFNNYFKVLCNTTTVSILDPQQPPSFNYT